MPDDMRKTTHPWITNGRKEATREAAPERRKEWHEVYGATKGGPRAEPDWMKKLTSEE